MKKILYTIGLFCFSTISFAQVSINTDTDKGTVYIDASGNGSENGSVIIDGDGNLAIGKTTVSTGITLDVVGNKIISKTDSIIGNLSVANVLTTDTIRFGSDSTTDIQSKTEFFSDKPYGALNLKQDIVTDQSKIPVLSKDANNNAQWTDLPAVSQVVMGALATDKRGVYSGISPVNITTTSLNLTPGMWLVMAGTATSSSNYVSTGGFLVYMQLRITGVLTGDPITITGAPTEYRDPWSTTGNIQYSGGVATPQLTYLLQVTQNTSYSIYLSTSITSSAYTIDTGFMGGTPYFYALKLDYTNN